MRRFWAKVEKSLTPWRFVVCFVLLYCFSCYLLARKLSDSDAGVAAAGILDEASETKIPKEEEPFEGEVFVPVPNHNTHVVEVGTLHTETYRCYLKDDDGNPLSLWHDVTLHAEKPTPESPQLYNMIVEVPRYSNARLEISHFEPMNPIVHAHADDGSLDYARNVFPFQGYPFNYGSFPQTFTDPNQKGDQPAPGDGDLVDAIEISQRRRKTGDIVKVKVLGAMAFIVNNRLDWKVVCVDAEDPISSKIKEVHQLEFVMPGIIRAIHEFFTLYNLPKGGGFTPVAFKGAYRKVDIAEQILGVSHSLWKNVIAQRQYGIPTETVIENRQPHGVVKASLKAWKQIVDSSPAHTKPAPEPPFVGKYYFVRTREES